MNIQIKLPSPDNFNGSFGLESYFDQLELAIFHARKSYEKMKSTVSSPEEVSCYISIDGIDGAEQVIKKIEDADKSKDLDRDETWFEMLNNLTLNISY